MFQEDLVFDLGMHNGTDTEYYLKKGFRVVGVDANPRLTDSVRERFRSEIADKRLFVENIGIHNSEGVLTFYLNLDIDEWSSFEKRLGTRDNTRFSTLEVPCRRLDYLIGKYGMPYYLKIDVEGLDAAIARDLTRWAIRPAYASVEDDGIDCLIALYETGARQFKFINQVAIRDYSPPKVALEGRSVEHSFGVGSSGPFGRELPGEWLEPASAFKFYTQSVRPPGQGPIDGWWDIHALYGKY